MNSKVIQRFINILGIGVILCTVLVLKDVYLTKVRTNAMLTMSQENSSVSDTDAEIPLEMQYDFHAPFSKDLSVHTAYFDQRPRNNHTNVTVIFLTINMTILNNGWVVGCGIDGNNATAFSLYSVFENYLLHDWLGKKPFLYENMEVLCYDMPGKNGSEVSVIYKTAPNSTEIKETSQHPLYIPGPRIAPTGKYDFTAVTCTKIHNRNVKLLHEFVQYQKTLGVDHVHADILDVFINDNGFKDLVINDAFLWQEYRKGYLSFSVWKDWYKKSSVRSGEVSLHSEILRKLSCIYRFLGTYDYAMPLDTDDFFVPRIPGKTKLKDYILQYCYSKPAGSCRFKWIWHHPECGLVGKITDGNVTKHLKTKIWNPSGNFKSFHSTKVFVDSSFHDARCPKCLKPGYSFVDIPTSIAYMAHIRYGQTTSRCANKGPLL